MKIGTHEIGNGFPTYFIADIAANHDGDLVRACDLIHLAADAGADAAKFQHFKAATIVSDTGFNALGSKKSHQAGWKKSVFQIYQDASLATDWTQTLADCCEKAGIDFLTSPYDLDLIDLLEPWVKAFKIGSGEITWLELIQKVSLASVPCILATGASSMDEVTRAVNLVDAEGKDYGLMQCNTNYTGSTANFQHINLRVLETYRKAFPRAVLGLSDHTHGHTTVLGAVALGASMIEKHFTDDRSREGPDHPFSVTPDDWREMVERTREMELSLGRPEKCVEENEKDTVVVQRRAARFTRDIEAGEIIKRAYLIPLRPCPPGSVEPHEMERLIGKKLKCAKKAGEQLLWTDVVA